MAILRCKMCGGELIVESDNNICECEYCGSKQTVPNLDDEKKINLFTRANRLRLNCEFDKAYGVYENIVAEFPEEAEAYWGLILCKYGIEYVDDPKDGRKVPTCHRSSFDSVMQDENFELVMEYAEGLAKRVYREEAKRIEQIRVGIVEVSSKEEPYDIFICYKETAEDGQRTIDSVIAQDVYEALTEQGYKVFFSRITLEDKLGQEYEPYIFAALNSAKVMLVFGTDYEYFNAVWVKNEWKRFLGLIEKGEKKTLVPCYKGVDVYDMPKEFSRLQAQDMGKVGAIQDLLRGIEKILPKNDEKAKIMERSSSVTAPTVDSLMKRAFIYLEDKNWSSANEYCEKVLDIDPENAKAYIAKLLAELHVQNVEGLAQCRQTFDSSNNYKKAIRFADTVLIDELEGYVKYIKERNEKERVLGIYNEAVKLMKSAINEEEYKIASHTFMQVKEYADAFVLAEQCVQSAEIARKDAIYEEACKGLHSENIRILKNSIGLFEKIPSWKDSEEKIQQCLEKIDKINEQNEHTRKENIYNMACKKAAQNSIASVEEAIRGYESIIEWRDSHIKIEECQEKIVKLEKEIEEKEILKKQNEEIERLKRKKTKIFAVCGLLIAVVGIVACFIVTSIIIPGEKYENVIGLIEKEEYRDAYNILLEIDGFKDSKEIKSEIVKNMIMDNISKRTLSAGDSYTVAVKRDGTVEATEPKGPFNDDEDIVFVNHGEFRVRHWKDIVSVSAANNHTVGLKKDGTVVSTIYYDASSRSYQYEGHDVVDSWKNIVAVSAGEWHTVGLKSDGTVVANGNNSSKQCDVEEWNDIVAVSASANYTVGLKSDGTVVATGQNTFGAIAVEEWTDIIAISTSPTHTVGLKADGAVIVTEWKNPHEHINYKGQREVSAWTDIIAVAAGYGYTVGLKSDGTVVATEYMDDYYAGQCDVEEWSDIVAISTGECHTVGLKSDGTVVATKYIGNYYAGQCDVESWTNIKIPE